MKQVSLTISIFVVANFFAACGTAPVENTSATNNARASNVNAAAAKTVAPAVTKETLMTIETKAWEAWKAKDEKFFQEMLTENTIGINEKGRVDKAAIIKSIIDPTCEVTSFSLSEDQMTSLGADVALLTYKATQDAKCGGNALPNVVRAATVAVRSGDQWKCAYHNEVPIADPKTASINSSDRKDATERPTYIAAKFAAADAGTDAMLTMEKAVWAAWKDHDGKKIEELTAKEISFINIFGTFFATKADAIKDWTSTGCQVKSVSVTDAVGTMLTPTVGILTFKGGADGNCFGQRVPPIWGTSIYVKDGDAWKWAFGMNLSAG